MNYLVKIGLLMSIVFSASGAFSEELRMTGIEQMTHLERSPLLRPDVQVHYEGSIDKLGKNADWDWWLYEDVKTKEWVIMEAQGPGCLWNFVVHHSVGHSDPVYRFYFDGSSTPGFEIKHSEFGSKPPFISPLADKFLPDVAKDPRLKKIDFQIVRSFCPMPFTKSLKITSSIKLQGNHTTGGGWGHAIWHSYPSSDGVHTFTGNENYSKLLDLWKHCGEDPKPQQGNENCAFSATIPGQSAQTVFSRDGEGSLSAIQLQVEPVSKEMLGQLWIRITWDGENSPAVECPIGAFFGNEFGYHKIQTLMQGTAQNGTMYCYWPMPFWRSAKVELVNRGKPGQTLKVSGTVVFKPTSAMAYPATGTGHFRTSVYQPIMPRKDGRDSLVALIRGSGHIVAGLISAKQSSCEGDVRVHIDGRGTPAVESDGSESWACYGWGFQFPPQANPASSYDGKGDPEWSMLRLLMGDFYTFRKSLRMTVEGGSGDNEVYRKLTLFNRDGKQCAKSTLAEIIIFNRNVSDTERKQIESYLTNNLSVSSTQELPVKNGCVLWLDAKDESTITKGLGDVVTLWKDKSPGRCDLTAAESHAPTYMATVLNVRPGIVFNEKYMIPSKAISANSGFSAFIVLRPFAVGYHNVFDNQGESPMLWITPEGTLGYDKGGGTSENVIDKTICTSYIAGDGYYLNGQKFGGTPAGGCEDSRSGMVFWYGEPEAAMVLTDFLDVGEPESEKKHEYTASKSSVWNLTAALEGEYDDVKITDTGRTLAGPSQFIVRIAAENDGVILRRRSDQSSRGQHASVYVDGNKIQERDWYYADRNTNFRWMEDEFIIPASYTKGKEQIHIRIDPVNNEDRINWNESFYWVFSLVKPSDKSQVNDISLPEKTIPPFEISDDQKHPGK